MQGFSKGGNYSVLLLIFPSFLLFLFFSQVALYFLRDGEESATNAYIRWWYEMKRRCGHIIIIIINILSYRDKLRNTMSIHTKKLAKI